MKRDWTRTCSKKSLSICSESKPANHWLTYDDGYDDDGDDYVDVVAVDGDS